MHEKADRQLLDRRQLFRLAGRRGMGVVALGGFGPALLAACATDDPEIVEPDAAAPSPPAPPDDDTDEADGTGEVEGTAIVGDVVDFALTSDEWAGPFGVVTFRMHRSLVDGTDLYYIRTDASDADYARENGLVSVPKIAVLAGTDTVVRAYFPADDGDDHPALVSSDPGSGDYSSAWQVHRYSWNGEPRPLESVADLEAAANEGALEVEETDIVLNASAVKWSGGELPVDDERTAYVGPGQLIEPPDVDAMTVTFKLHECYPNVRYIVTDTALSPMADGMAVVHTPQLAGATEAGATGRTNVFMNGLEGPGPMGFQPSVFDRQAGDPEWSPYWDHMTYAWADDATPRLLTTEEEIHEARDAGELEEFPGVPDTEGETFVVNCPVPALADNTFEA